MADVKIAAIVEGHGECEAVPILIRRIARDIYPGFVPNVLSPVRVPVSKLLKEGEIERTVIFSARKLKGKGGIIIIVDCDWDNGCPAKDGPALLKRAVSARNDMPISVILAKKEYEAWFLAAAESLRDKRGLPNNLMPPEAPESIRGAKEWLSDKMPPGKSYAETIDQPAFTEIFDMNVARTADSFDKCYREIRHMLENLRNKALSTNAAQ
jgi:hypothetical protein